MDETTDDGTLRVEIADDGVVVIHGDIDIAGGAVLETALLAIPADAPLVLDLGDVLFVDSSGLRRLLDASTRAAAGGSEVVLRNVGARVTRLLEVTGTADRFTIETADA